MALDGTLAVGCSDLFPFTFECEFCKALHFDCEKIIRNKKKNSLETTDEKQLIKMSLDRKHSQI